MTVSEAPVLCGRFFFCRVTWPRSNLVSLAESMGLAAACFVCRAPPTVRTTDPAYLRLAEGGARLLKMALHIKAWAQRREYAVTNVTKENYFADHQPGLLDRSLGFS